MNIKHGDKNGMCVLDETLKCDDCGECDICDLNPLKICDNCGKCINFEDVASIKIDSIEKTK